MRIPINELRNGDVLLYHGTDFVAEAIRLFDGSEYSHSSVVIEPNAVEAIGTGVVARSVQQSVGEFKFVDVYRFISNDGKPLGDANYPVQPILNTAQNFVATGERYAYEQLLLLAALTVSRRIPVVSDIPFLRWLLRNIVDSAADILNKIVAAGKEPMICSELVYRCYAESGDKYALTIRGSDTLKDRVRSIPPIGGQAITFDGPQSPDAAAIQSDLDSYLAKYILVKSRHRSVPRAARKTTDNKRAQRVQPSGIDALAVADFVTPRDLRDSPNLQKVGSLQY